MEKFEPWHHNSSETNKQKDYDINGYLNSEIWQSLLKTNLMIIGYNYHQNQKSTPKNQGSEKIRRNQSHDYFISPRREMQSSVLSPRMKMYLNGLNK